ncbi:MAG: tetratricopeptide repeat protein [Polyangia bacterium]
MKGRKCLASGGAGAARRAGWTAAVARAGVSAAVIAIAAVVSFGSLGSLGSGVSIGGGVAVAAEPPPPELCTPPTVTVQPGKKLSKKEKKQLAQSLEKARVAYEARRFDEAAQALRQVYALDPQDDVLYNLAQACREAGRLAQALPIYEMLQSQTQDTGTRADALRNVAELRSQLADREDQKANQLLGSQDFVGAATAWEAAYLFRPEPLYLFRRAQALQKAGQGASALAMYQRFLEAVPQSPKAAEAKERVAELQAAQRDEQATKLSDEGKHAEAAAAWQEAYRLAPQPLYLFRLAEAQRQKGDKPAAIDSYERFLVACPKNEHRELRAQAQEAVAALRAGRAILSGRVAPTQPPRTPVYKKWWFWTAIGVGAAAVAGGVAAGVLLSRPTPDPFASFMLDQNPQMTKPVGN